MLKALESNTTAGNAETVYCPFSTGTLSISSTSRWGAFAGTTICLESSKNGVVLEDEDEDEDDEDDELLEELLEELEEGGVSGRYAHFASV